MKAKNGKVRRELGKTLYTDRPWNSGPKFKRNAIICQEKNSMPPQCVVFYCPHVYLHGALLSGVEGLE